MTRARTWVAALTAIATAIGNAGSASAAWYAKFDGVDGPSKKDFYKGWIELNSVTPALTPQTPRGPGTLVINKLVDSASPKLKDAAASRKTFATVRMDVTGPQGGTAVHYELKDVQITSYQTRPASDGRPTEEVAFYYNRISFNYASTPGR